MEIEMEVDRDSVPLSGVVLGLSQDDVSNQNCPSAVVQLKCIMGCKIDGSKPVIALYCLHFICSDECLAKFKATKVSGMSLSCNICYAMIRVDELERKIVPQDIFAAIKPCVTDVKLCCEYCVDGLPAIAYCLDCKLCLCADCKRMHPRMRATQTHNVSDDLSEPKTKEVDKKKEIESKCANHSMPLTDFCLECNIKICPNCRRSHEGHSIFEIEKEKDDLQTKVDMFRKQSERLNRAIQDIGRKREEILNLECRSISIQIDNVFKELIEVLEKRMDTLLSEARKQVMRKVAELNTKRICTNFAKGLNDRFARMASQVVRDGENIAPGKFMRQYQRCTEMLQTLDDKLAFEYDDYVHQGWHFKLEVPLLDDRVREYLSGYGKLEYKLTPDVVQLMNSVKVDESCQNQMESPRGTSHIAEGTRTEIPCIFVPNNNSNDAIETEVDFGQANTGGDPEVVAVEIGENSTILIVTEDELEDAQEPAILSRPIKSSSKPSKVGGRERKKKTYPEYVCELLKNRTRGEKPEVRGSSSSTIPHKTVKKGPASVASSHGGNLNVVKAVNDNFPKGPKESMESVISFKGNFPKIKRVSTKSTKSTEHTNEDYCCICLDGGVREDVLLCCDNCPKVFHLGCHIPEVKVVPPEDERWECNYETTKQMIDEQISLCPFVEGSEKLDITESNQRQYILACKFLMECYKIKEISTMGLTFPDGFKNKYGKCPYHLNYIKQRLCRSIPEPFRGVVDMMSVFKEMFKQAAQDYQRKPNLDEAITCYEKFLLLIDLYYPDFRDFFDDSLFA